MPYTEQELTRVKEREFSALDELSALVAKYSDVIAIPEVVALSDILDYRIETENGVKQFKDVYDSRAAVHVINRFAHRDLLTQEKFEDTILTALGEVET
jgi:hypothetical protein